MLFFMYRKLTFASVSMTRKLCISQKLIFSELFALQYIQLNTDFYQFLVIGCGGNLLEPEGTITSPGFPLSRYDNNLNCHFIVALPAVAMVDIEVTDIDIEYHHSCNYDVLKVK